MRYLIYILAILLLISCGDHKPYQKFLNENNLASASFVVDNTRDTILQTNGGVKIIIPSGSFNKERVTLEVKEAITLQDMVMAGLTTTTNGKPLSSGGMLRISSPDKAVEFRKAIEVSVPTESFDPQMQLYKGEEQDGVLNWDEPRALKDSMSPWLVWGKQVFEKHCTSCHQIDKNLLGPALRGLEKRGPWKNRQELIKFTSNPAYYIPTTKYTAALQKQYGQIMPGYPCLGNDALNAIYDYIKSFDGYKIDRPLPPSFSRACEDSCRLYDSLVKVLSKKNLELVELESQEGQHQGERINYKREGVEPRIENGPLPKPGPASIPIQNEERVLTYRFDITSFGWYNIDRLLDFSKRVVNLQVMVDETLTKELDVFIAVPELKAFDRGGRLNDERYFGFYSMNGKVNFNLGTKVAVFVIGEHDKQILFDYKQISIVDNNEIMLTPKKLSAEGFASEIKKMDLADVQMDAIKIPGLEEIQKATENLNQISLAIQKIKPKNCGCTCGNESVRADTVSH